MDNFNIFSFVFKNLLSYLKKKKLDYNVFFFYGYWRFGVFLLYLLFSLVFLSSFIGDLFISAVAVFFPFFIDSFVLNSGFYFNFFSNSFFFFVEIILLFFFIVIFLYELYLIKFVYNRHHVNYIIYFMLPGLLFILYFLVVDLFVFENIFVVFSLNFIFSAGYFIIFSKFFILLLVIIVFLLSLDYFDFEKFQVFEYPLLLLLSLLGAFLLISVSDFFILYLLLEFVSFSFYILASLKRYSNLSIEASLKYFILGSFSSALLLFGLSLFYGFFGTTNFFEIFVLIFSLDIFVDNYFILLFGLLFISVGLLFKLAVFPFHFWIADIYEGSPLIVMVFFAILSKFIFLILFVKIFSFVFFRFFFFFSYFLFIIGLFSIFVGILLALYELKLRRLLAFSAISHVGYILLAFSSFSLYGLDLFFIYLFVYVITIVNMFSVLLFFRFERFFFELKYLVELSLLTKVNFFLAVVVAVILLSFAGVPPFAGFFGKLYIFISLLEFHNYFLVGLAVFLGVLNSVFYLS